MSEDKNTEEEPSIEEILDSIRQIISDDDEEDGPAVEEPEAEPEEDVVELTEKVAEAPPEPEPEPVPEPAPAPAQKAEPEPIEVDMQDSVPEPPPPPPPPSTDDALLTNQAESAAYDGFSELARKTAVHHGGVTVEEIVRTELRPLLREWLDKYLPSIIERLVQEELERVSKRALEE